MDMTKERIKTDRLRGITQSKEVRDRDFKMNKT